MSDQKPPHSRRVRRALRPDRYRKMDPERQCSRCGQQGLARRNASGLCATCHRHLPIGLKAGVLALHDVQRRHVTDVWVYMTPDGPHDARARRAAQILQIDTDELWRLLGRTPAANDDR